jgi:ribonuclease HII
MPSPPATVTEARLMLALCGAENLPGMIRRLSRDPREGVRRLAATAGARLEREAAEQRRLDALMTRQYGLHALGLAVVAGIDEVGRGALAGPVTACAVVLDPSSRIVGLNDSKRLTRESRIKIADVVCTSCVAYCVAHVGPADIDRYGIAPATRRAWAAALEGLRMHVDHVLLDGNDPGALPVPTTAVVRGDSSESSIAAASVVAKVARDRLMAAAAESHPGYGFEVNFGYGTPEHMAAIAELGPSTLHRISFAPLSAQDALF